jgi:hypothetical protein
MRRRASCSGGRYGFFYGMSPPHTRGEMARQAKLAELPGDAGAISGGYQPRRWRRFSWASTRRVPLISLGARLAYWWRQMRSASFRCFRANPAAR